ncbi:MAG: class IV adenylate cyclase [Gemmataceae bacterium]
MLEIEMKFPVTDHGALESRLREWPAEARETLDEADHYFNAPDRDFACTDEALRLRRIGPVNRVTYKGPKQAGPTKTRVEIEVPLEAGEHIAQDFMRLLCQLGYRPVAVVRKRRRIFTLPRQDFQVEICLDEVEDLGLFAEVEIVAAEHHQDSAQEVLQAIAAELGLQKAERRSYLEMLLAQKGQVNG